MSVTLHELLGVPSSACIWWVEIRKVNVAKRDFWVHGGQTSIGASLGHWLEGGVRAQSPTSDGPTPRG